MMGKSGTHFGKQSSRYLYTVPWYSILFRTFFTLVRLSSAKLNSEGDDEEGECPVLPGPGGGGGPADRTQDG